MLPVTCECTLIVILRSLSARKLATMMYRCERSTVIDRVFVWFYRVVEDYGTLKVCDMDI